MQVCFLNIKQKMEGKTPFGAMIMGVLILSLFVTQTQVEAKSCCKTTASRNCYNVCRFTGKVSRKNCAALCISCKIIDETVCPSDYPKTSLESSDSTIYDYCKLGCASSVCNSISTLQISDASEEVANKALELCNDACSDFCTKGSKIGLVTAA